MSANNWNKLAEILKDQETINKVLMKHLERVDARLAKLEKKTRKKKESKP